MTQDQNNSQVAPTVTPASEPKNLRGLHARVSDFIKTLKAFKLKSARGYGSDKGRFYYLEEF